MSIFSASIQHRSFHVQISALCFVLGLLLAAAWFTAGQINRSGAGLPREGFVFNSGLRQVQAKAQQYETEIKKLRDQITNKDHLLSVGGGAALELNRELQETKFIAGLTEVAGEGVQITLTDSRRPQIPPDTFRQNNLIHDSDIANVVNELKASGAEAIAVNGQRVVASTAIRCVGPVVHVNGVPAAPPYVVQAIGEPATMYNGLNMVGGVLELIRRYDPDMARIEKKKALRLNAFAGSTVMRYARPIQKRPPPAQGEQAEKEDREK